MTELCFESAEPCFNFDLEECPNPLDTDEFFNRFPEGTYRIEGVTLEGDELENEVFLSHIIPAAPSGVKVNDEDVAESCDAELPEVSRPVRISWSAEQVSHREKHDGDGEKIALGREGPVDIRYYEVVVEIDESDFNSKSIIPRVPDGDGRVSWTIPDDFFQLTDEDEYKFEIIIRTNVFDDNDLPVMVEIDDGVGLLPGNQSAMESCFTIAN